MILIILKRAFKPCAISIKNLSHSVLLPTFPLPFIQLPIYILAFTLSIKHVVKPTTFIYKAIFVNMFSVPAFFILNEIASVVRSIFQYKQALPFLFIIFKIAFVDLSVNTCYFMVSVLFHHVERGSFSVSVVFTAALNVLLQFLASCFRKIVIMLVFYLETVGFLFSFEVEAFLNLGNCVSKA